MLALSACALGLFFILSAGLVTPSFAHTTIAVDKYDVEAGWDVEPPIVGLRNSVILSVVERGEIEGQSTGVTHVFRGVGATILFGGESKVLAFNPTDLPGHYKAPIIPTRTGTYLLQVQGDIRGTPVDIVIPVEDVEHTAALDFPPVAGGGSSSVGGSGGADAADIIAIKKAVSSLQQDVSGLRSGEGVAVPGNDSGAGGLSYNFAVMGLSMSAVAIVMGVISLTRRPAA
ncbi:MAG: hypothetical protein J4F28_01125 [Nitrosopumilaceae archaeon]|nr:hypothetical protein [Nitrosopumilaceae archaeon]